MSFFQKPRESESILPHFHCQPLFFRQEKFREELKKQPPVKVFKDAIAGINTHFNFRFKEGADIRQLIAERAAFIDLILHYAWHQFKWDDDIALIAVGGYGRGELHPKSDIDILILLQNNVSKKYNDNIQSLVTFLWDIGLEIGSSVRTLKDCIAIAKNDITVATNLIEARRITGNDKLRDELQIKTDAKHMWPVAEFYKAKWQEQRQRHAKHGHTEYNLEPNIKNAPGGLRDIQMINWVAKRFFAVQSLAKLEGQDFFTEHEYGILRNGEAFLWKVRYGVHMLAGRAEERLLFEHQRELANIFGYEDDESSMAVEKFMHDYYRSVMALRALNDVLLQYLNEKINRPKRAKKTKINDRFELYDNYIRVTRPSVFHESPSALLEVFVILGNNRNITGIRASTIRLIWENRFLIDEDFRNNPVNNQLFMSLFSIEHGLVTQLKRMRRYGILGRYLPEFGEITGQMQHDLFHQYTVDAHTMLVIKNIRRFTYPDELKQFPVAAHIMKRLPKKELLLIAGLYHDIGKGRGGDHSMLGAEFATHFCERHNISPRETRLVSWLVEKHLLMSYVSQKQDISDPEVIRNFAITVGNQTRLDYLYALTVADMCGTNPNIWNAWRASLMRNLYLETKRALRRGLEKTIDQAEIIEETQSLAAHKLADKNITREQAETIWKNLGDEYFIREGHLDIAWHTESILNHQSDEPLILARKTLNLQFDGATQIFIHMRDSKNIFATVASSLAQLSLNIQDARIYTSANGYTVDTFYVLDENYKPLGNVPKRFARIEKTLKRDLKNIGVFKKTATRRTPRQLKSFSMPTTTSICTDNTNGTTVFEVISPDRTGLLATIGRIFAEFNIQLQNAKISTLGERVEDAFFITDEKGNALEDPDICHKLQKRVREELDRQVEQDLAS